MYKTIIQVEVLSDSSIGDCQDLGVINEMITTGDCSGSVKTLSETQLTKPQMAAALQAQASDPGFLLGEDGWKYTLAPGDEVGWNDPDDGKCSRRITIHTIEFVGDDIFRIQDTDGDVVEGYVTELS